MHVAHLDDPSAKAASRDLRRVIEDCGSLTVLTGAGVSTASGIPDYRDHDGEWKNAAPIQYGDFVRSEAYRRRYWARSFAGWHFFSSAAPNGTHRSLVMLERLGKIDTLITQNVDGLHQDAGSNRVIDLHGNLARVRCLDCDSLESRRSFQERLAELNPAASEGRAAVRPDGDAAVPDTALAKFTPATCQRCGGVVKPDVVMFGEAVPKARVQQAFDAVDRADVLMVIGSSLMVYSGYRFAKRVNETGKPLVIVNIGRTRADEFATLKVEEDCGKVLQRALNGMVLEASTSNRQLSGEGE